MDDLIVIGTFDFSKNSHQKSQNIDTEELTQKIFETDNPLIRQLPLSKKQRLQLTDIQYAIFELAKLNKANVNIKLDYEKLIYCVKIESTYFKIFGEESCYKLQQIFSGSNNVIVRSTHSNKIIVDISIDLKLKIIPNPDSISTYLLSSQQEIKLSSCTITELKFKDATYGSYPVYTDILYKIKGETKYRNATIFIDKPLKIQNVKLLIPEENGLKISNDDRQILQQKLWTMYFHKAVCAFYKKPSALSLIKTVSENLKYLRWTKGLSIFKGAKAIGVNPFILFKLEKGKFKHRELHEIDFDLLKNTYGIEKSDLFIRRNFEFMKDGYLTEQ